MPDDKEIISAINDAKKLMKSCQDMDGNEAETRRRVERIFETVMGYDVFLHLSRERAVKGAAETEYCDFAIQLEPGKTAKPVVMVELKKVCTQLAPKHLKQVSSYAINVGCEWILLTNGNDWQLYHVAFGQPPITTLIDSWSLLDDEPKKLLEKFNIVSFKNIKKGNLATLWQKAHVLRPENVIKAIVSEESINLIRRYLKRENGVSVSPAELISAIRKLFNEAAGREMDSLKICLPETAPRKKAEKQPTQSINLENIPAEQISKLEAIEEGEDKQTTSQEVSP